MFNQSRNLRNIGDPIQWPWPTTDGAGEVFHAGFEAGLALAAALHESIDPACQHEPGHGAGAGAMGAIIAYRDAIRAINASRPPIRVTKAPETGIRAD